MNIRLASLWRVVSLEFVQCFDGAGDAVPLLLDYRGVFCVGLEVGRDRVGNLEQGLIALVLSGRKGASGGFEAA